MFVAQKVLPEQSLLLEQASILGVRTPNSTGISSEDLEAGASI